MNLRDVASAAVLLSRFGRNFHCTKSESDPNRIAEFCLCISFARRYWDRQFNSILIPERPLNPDLQGTKLKSLLEEIAVAETLLRVTLASIAELLDGKTQFSLARCQELRELQNKISQALDSDRRHTATVLKCKRLRASLDAWSDLLLSGMGYDNRPLLFAVDSHRASDFRAESLEDEVEPENAIREQLELAAFRLVVPNREVSDETTTRIFGEWIEFAMYFISGASLPVKVLPVSRNHRMIGQIYSSTSCSSDALIDEC